MADLHHEIHIAASHEAVLASLVTQQGLQGWWTADCVATPQLGSVAEFGFGGRSTVFRMKVTELSDYRVVWRCLGDVAEWKGTRLIWDVLPRQGGVTVRLTHADWAAIDGWFAACNSTWGALMHRLRAHAEGRNPGPMFTD